MLACVEKEQMLKIVQHNPIHKYLHIHLHPLFLLCSSQNAGKPFFYFLSHYFFFFYTHQTLLPFVFAASSHRIAISQCHHPLYCSSIFSYRHSSLYFRHSIFFLDCNKPNAILHLVFMKLVSLFFISSDFVEIEIIVLHLWFCWNWWKRLWHERGERGHHWKPNLFYQ